MSNRSGEPAWRSALNLAILFWVGIALAPVSIIIMFASDSGGAFKLALIAGLGSVVLIGSSVALRRDPDDVDAELSDSINKLELETRRNFAEIRTQLRQVTLEGGPRPGPTPNARDLPSGERPRPQPPKPPRQAPSSVRGRHDERGDAVYSPPRYGGDYGGEPSPPAGGQRRRPEAAFEETGEMVRVTESVSVTRRQTTRTSDTGGHRRHETGPRAEGEAGVYRGKQVQSGLSGKISKLRQSKRRDDPADRSDADSLLAGLAAEPGHADDWLGDSGGRRDTGRHVDHDTRGRDRDGRDDHRRRGGRGEDSGQWHAEERSAEFRMGVRQSRGGPVDAWTDRRGYADDGYPQGGGHREETPNWGDGSDPYSPEREPRRITSYEAEPQTRWSEQDRPRGRSGSYMDDYYGDRR